MIILLICVSILFAYKIIIFLTDPPPPKQWNGKWQKFKGAKIKHFLWLIGLLRILRSLIDLAFKFELHAVLSC